MAQLDYAKSGVNREAADQFVDRISILAKSTLNRRVKASIGGYASLYELDSKRWLAASTDGVGTKLKLAFRLGEHRTIGVDLVAMSVNDILCVGALPLFFLDYFATGKLSLQVAEHVLEGIVQGCKLAGCALVGGETAEMPDFYSPGEYDLGGFAVGMVEPKAALPKKTIKPGDAILGIASTGCHSTGYSLLRKWIPEGSKGDDKARELLSPTRIYVKALSPLLEKGLVSGLAHITGSGFLNVPRMSEKVSYEIQLPQFKVMAMDCARVFEWVRSRSGLPLSELVQTFNMGVGMVIVLPQERVKEALRSLKRSGERAWILGEVVKKRGAKGSQVHLTDEGTTVSI